MGFEDKLIDKGIFLRKLRKVTDELEKHVVPIFTLDKERKPDLEGSGIIAKLKNKFYLISAAHVFDNCKHGVFLLEKEMKGEPLKGEIIVTGRKPGTTREDDKTDIGFVRLTDDEINIIDKNNFLDLDYISAPPMAISTTVFLVLGFPARDQITDNKNSAIEYALTMFLTANANENAYEKAQISKNSNILLRYNKKNIMTRNNIGSPPSFKGISGGGVFPLSIFHDPEKDKKPIFAGIVIEQPKNYSPSLLVTRGNLIRAFIEKFDI